ncbi:hypothetical protein F511_29365 [Dorcoceras hygrometricum]|uniref:Uncharacterized protein n=1 Tax=Dorcoceras hygrometricum TaxID=472368 RepID=A0A2Z7CR76_9LAMI|nr:hypothetical protein F511_29365 [Dorcoceras hygrometricum]
MRRIRSCQNPSDLLVQIDEGIVFPVVDLIRRSTAAYNSRASFPVILVGARRLDASKVTIDKHPMNGLLIDFNVLNVSRGKIFNFRYAPGKRDPDPPLSPTWYQSQGSDPSIQIMPELYRFQLFQNQQKKLKKAAGDLHAAAPLRAAREAARAPLPDGQHALSRAGRPPCANVAHGVALVAPCMARPFRARRGRRAALCRTMCIDGGRRRAAAVRRPSDSVATADFF